MLAGKGLNNPTQWRANLQPAGKVPTTSLTISGSNLKGGSSFSVSHITQGLATAKNKECQEGPGAALTVLDRNMALKHTHGMHPHPWNSLLEPAVMVSSEINDAEIGSLNYTRPSFLYSLGCTRNHNQVSFEDFWSFPVGNTSSAGFWTCLC